jgi:hypothetical protein
VTTGGVYLLAALAVAGHRIATGQWRPLPAAGAMHLLCLMALFFGPTR